jgi:hypothetical protein
MFVLNAINALGAVLLDNDLHAKALNNYFMRKRAGQVCEENIYKNLYKSVICSLSFIRAVKRI